MQAGSAIIILETLGRGVWKYFRESLRTCIFEWMPISRSFMWSHGTDHQVRCLTNSKRFLTILIKLMFDLFSCHSHFTLFTCDFNAKSKNWSKYDTTTAKRSTVGFSFYTILYKTINNGAYTYFREFFKLECPFFY